MSDIPDYKERVYYAPENIELVLDRQTPREERVGTSWMNISVFAGQGIDKIRVVSNFLDPELFDDVIIFHEVLGLGFYPKDGEWHEVTGFTDFYRGIAESNDNWREI